MIKKMLDQLRDQKGLTFVEILVSIAILSLIVGPFLSMFVISTKTNIGSQDLVDTTYLAQNLMEDLYRLSITPPTNDFEQSRQALEVQGFYETRSGDIYRYAKEVEGHTIHLRIDTGAYSGALYKVVIEVYRNSDMQREPTKMENIIKWE